MHHYVLIFRPTHPLTADERKQRSVEIPAWVKRVGQMGIPLDPKALAPSAVRLSQQNGSIVTEEGSADPTLTNLVFFDAAARSRHLKSHAFIPVALRRQRGSAGVDVTGGQPVLPRNKRQQPHHHGVNLCISSQAQQAT